MNLNVNFCLISRRNAQNKNVIAAELPSSHLSLSFRLLCACELILCGNYKFDDVISTKKIRLVRSCPFLYLQMRIMHKHGISYSNCMLTEIHAMKFIFNIQ